MNPHIFQTTDVKFARCKELVVSSMNSTISRHQRPPSGYDEAWRRKPMNHISHLSFNSLQFALVCENILLPAVTDRSVSEKIQQQKSQSSLEIVVTTRYKNMIFQNQTVQSLPAKVVRKKSSFNLIRFILHKLPSYT